VGVGITLNRSAGAVAGPDKTVHLDGYFQVGVFQIHPFQRVTSVGFAIVNKLKTKHLLDRIFYKLFFGRGYIYSVLFFDFLCINDVGLYGNN